MDEDVRPLTAVDLIKELERIVAEHGDLPVCMWDDEKVENVVAYDADGDTKGRRVEIVIHAL